MKMLITTVLTTVFVISMTAFVLSFNACLNTHEPVIAQHKKATSSVISATPPNFKKERQNAPITPVFDKAELIVFNSEGEVVYNEIIPSI
mgnify:FL=1